MSGWTWLWLGWLGLFAVIEGAALVHRGRLDTLSDHLWWWLGRGQPATAGVRLRRLALVAFTAWLLGHVYGFGWV